WTRTRWVRNSHVQQQRQKQPGDRAEDGQAATARGQCAQDQGLPGCNRSKKLLFAKCTQGPAPRGGPLQRESLPASQILHPVLRA
ncbi:hypothetical protein Z043_118463, partial [Scleropages formosus]